MNIMELRKGNQNVHVNGKPHHMHMCRRHGFVKSRAGAGDGGGKHFLKYLSSQKYN